MRITPNWPLRTDSSRYYLIILLSLLEFGLAVPGHATTPSEAEQWLDKMVQAARSLNYDGTFVYRAGPQLESMRIIHRTDPDGSQRERLISLSGAPWEVLRDGTQVTCILPSDRSVVIGKSRQRPFLSSALFKKPEQRSQYYSFSIAGSDRVAGRPTEIVAVAPLDRYRYGFRLWVDHDTGLLLKSELIGEEGKALEQFVYTSVEVRQEIPDQLLKPGLSGSGFKRYQHGTGQKPSQYPATLPLTSDDWQVRWVPPGFVLSDQASDSVPKRHVSVRRLVYTDGLSSFLVLIEPLESAAEGQQGLSKMGAVHAYGRFLDGFQITAFGEVPPTTVEKVGMSIERSPP
ncbi:MAG: MucB/RseB C-terminal domain-containing protein [Gammaproteobacteria bacterium]